MIELLKDTKKQFKCNHAYDSGGNKTRKFYLELAEGCETKTLTLEKERFDITCVRCGGHR